MLNENYKGKLLISSPEIVGDLFDKSIILICEHDANGTMGFILNKPLTDVSLGTIWANLGYGQKTLNLANEDVFIGGPLASNAIRGSRVSITKSLLLSWVDFLLLLDAGRSKAVEKNLICIT